INNTVENFGSMTQTNEAGQFSSIRLLDLSLSIPAKMDALRNENKLTGDKCTATANTDLRCVYCGCTLKRSVDLRTGLCEAISFRAKSPDIDSVSNDLPPLSIRRLEFSGMTGLDRCKPIKSSTTV